jgi:S-adenosylmethionine:tRNA ribosyltransferase-isomerase
VTPASWPREDPLAERMLVIDPARRSFDDASVGDLRRALREGDLLVVNDAATFPGSLRGLTATGAVVEIRLAAEHEDGTWTALLFGDGDWRTRTEDRPPAPAIARGERLLFGGSLVAVIEALDAEHRVATIRFDRDSEASWQAIYALGRPIQYAHVRGELPLWHVQNRYAGRPWAAEMPSAGHALTWELLLDLRRKGVELAAVTHAAGISSTGSVTLDATLPWPERFLVPAETARTIGATRRRGGRVIAIGTSVVRALESAVDDRGEPVASSGVTTLLLGPRSTLRVVDGIFTGVHEIGTSHRALLGAFAPAELLASAYDHAERAGYLGHEFGDATLVLRGALLESRVTSPSHRTPHTNRRPARRRWPASPAARFRPPPAPRRPGNSSPA